MSDGSEYDKLVGLVTGCRNDGDGIEAKRHIVDKHVETYPDKDKLQILCQLHASKCLQLSADALLGVLKWRKPPSASGFSLSAVEGHPGFFLTTVLATASPDEMLSVAKAYMASNEKLDQVDLIRYTCANGFIEFDAGQQAEPAVGGIGGRCGVSAKAPV